MRILSAVLAIAFATPAMAQPACGPRANIIAVLGGKYAETLTQFGIAGQTNLLEVFTSDKGKTWTIIQTTPDGVTCVMAAGQDWQAGPPQVAGQGT